MVKKTTKAPAKKVATPVANKVAMPVVEKKVSMPEMMSAPARRVSADNADNMKCAGLSVKTWVILFAVLLVANLIVSFAAKSAISKNEALKVGGEDNYETLMQLYEHPQFEAMQKQQIEGALQQMDMMAAQSGTEDTSTTPIMTGEMPQ